MTQNSDQNRELADFLRRARSQCDPTRAGLPADGRVRRVPGLRREEVAVLAGVSTDYYARLEQGRRIVPSPSVVEAVGRALGLNAAGQMHLSDLVGLTTGRRSRPRAPAVQRLRPGLYQLLDSLDGEPALILGRHATVLGQNRMAKALFTDFERLPGPMRNYARWIFLDPEARSLFVDWEVQARAAVESLRLEAGNAPDDRATAELIAELEESREFTRWWSEHRVFQRTHGSKRLRHPIVGDLTVDYETLMVPDDPGTTIFVYTTEANSPSRRAMDMLASWSLVSGRAR